MKRYFALLLVLILLVGNFGCSQAEVLTRRFTAGFAREVIELVELDECYIAGYHNARRPMGVLDTPECRAVWIDDGANSTVIVAVDCVGLDGGTVGEIRSRLANFVRESGCDQINVVSTHTHAGIDTLGLWGEIGVNGKNPEYIENLIEAAVGAACAAYESRTSGSLYYGKTVTAGMQRDSRDIQAYDTNLYQLRFEPDDGGRGIRILSFAAHAESLRGDNCMISRDFPGMLCDLISERSTDDALFLPGAIGGLIMTPEFSTDRPENLRITAEKLADYALSIEDSPLSARLDISRVEFETELDNTLFLYYKFLGILTNEMRRTPTGKYLLKSELSLLRLGEVTLGLIPGEIFPELILGTGMSEESEPKPLCELARAAGIDELVVIGLANDELGYIIPPEDYVLHEKYPYVVEGEGDHYEETNSVGIGCAAAIARAFERALDGLG